MTYSATRPQLEGAARLHPHNAGGPAGCLARQRAVQLTGFGASSIDLLVRYYARTGALADFLQVQEQVNLELMGLVQAAGCSFAFPSTSVYIEKN